MHEVLRRSFIVSSLLALAASQTASAQGLQTGYQAPVSSVKPRLKVAILVFEGVEIIDFCGPYEVFGQAGYEVFTVGATTSPLLTAMNLQITPTYAFGSSPAADILLIPGGNINEARYDAATLDWIRNCHAESKITMSVCNGALILAQTGLLANLSATTFHNAIDDLATGFRNIKVVDDKRFVDNGKIITTAGLSSGIDGAMHVVSRMEGKIDAELVARKLEYDWNEDTKFARAVLADYPICKAFGDRLNLYMPDGSAGKVESSTGDSTRWEAAWRLESKSTSSEIVQALSARITDTLKWQADPASSSPSQQTWRLTDPRNRRWTIRLNAAETAQPGVKRVVMRAILAG